MTSAREKAAEPGHWRPALIGGALLWTLLAYCLDLPPFESGPVYWENVEGGAQVYGCNGGGLGAPTLPIRFSQQGRIATITVHGRDVPLRYAGSEWLAEDVYRSGPWKLTLDPEANLDGPGGLHFTNCY
jgi:hypothetical protein